MTTGHRVRHAPPMRASARVSARPLAATAMVLAAALAAATLLLAAEVTDAHRRLLDLPIFWPDVTAGLVLAGAGALVLNRLPRQPLGWVMLGWGLWWLVDTAAAAWLAYATQEATSLPGASFAFWLYQRAGSGLLLVLPLTLLLYPEGRLPAGRWRPAAVASVAAISTLLVLLLFAPSSVASLAADGGALPQPLRGLNLDPTTIPLPDGLWLVLLRIAYLLLPAGMVVPFVVVVRRYRAATGLQRTRLRWLLWAALADLLLLLTFRLLPDATHSALLTLCIGVTASSVAIGLLRPDLLDIDLLLGSTLVYGVLLVVALAVEAVVLGTVGGVLGGGVDREQALVVAVFLVSALYGPLRHRLWRVVRRAALGERDDPYRVVSGLAKRLEESAASESQLAEIAAAVARAFRVRYVGVEIEQVSGGQVLVEHGPRPDRTEAMPISYRGAQIGRLLLPEERATLRSSDERLLADMVRQAAAAARAGQLAEELQRSRVQLVTAVEDERRRLRNELHDGLGPTLAAIASRIDMARITARTSPEQADGTLGLAREEVTGVLAEVRRLVHGLRPPALDDVGLAGAVRQQVDRLRDPRLSVEVSSTPGLAGLPAAVEVAAYRIVSEALTNVVRHANASRCSVALDLVDDELVVRISDDGAGIAADVAAGVGLVSLRERVDELAGRFALTSGETGGTTLTAYLPVSAGAPATVGSTTSEGRA